MSTDDGEIVREHIRLRGYLPIGVLSLLLAAVSFPVTVVVGSNNDPSWRAGLAIAFVHHLQWGTQVNFTYGPLGFLIDPVLYYQSTSILATFFILVEYAVFIFTLYVLFRRTFGELRSIIITYILGSTIIEVAPPETLLLGLAFLVAVWTLGSATPKSDLAGCVFLGVLGAVGGLIVLSVGLESALLIVVVGATSRARSRSLLAGFATFIVLGIVLWCLVGGPLGDLPNYVSGARALTTGYSSAMGISGPVSTLWTEIGVCSFACAISMIYAAVTNRSRALVGRILSSVVMLIFIIHEGFIRDDAAHEIRFFTLILLVPIGFLVAGKFQSGYVVCLTAVLAVTWIVSGYGLSTFLNPVPRARSIVTQVADEVNPTTAARIIKQGKAILQATYEVPSSMISVVRHETTAIEPWPGDTNLAWAYSLDKWDPEPILQAYSAYTDGLDSQDSRFLDSNGAPQAILQGIPMAIDGRYAAWEPPTTELTMLCRYRQLAISSSWELLGRVPNRCGLPQLLETKTVHAGNFVPVPVAPTGDIEVATFSGLGTSLSYRLASVAFKPAVVVVNIQISIYLVATRILTGTQGDYHVLSVPPSAGFSSPFSPDTILDVQFDGLYSSSGSATIKFYAVPIH